MLILDFAGVTKTLEGVHHLHPTKKSTPGVHELAHGAVPFYKHHC